MLNFKANHRKLLITDAATATADDREPLCIVGSANPHDGSSAHSNVALEVRGELARHLFSSELDVVRNACADTAVADAMLDPLMAALPAASISTTTTASATADILTESRIRAALVEELARATPDTVCDVAVFYLSDRIVIEALIAAAARGAQLRVILDPNKDAFGYEKNGVPNRPVAAELLRRGEGRIAVRWYATQGEQFHAKLFLRRDTDGTAMLMLGSANYTRRNLGDFNLETNVRLSGPAALPAIADAAVWFERIWSNTDGEFTVAHDAYADDSRWHRMLYRLQERTGLGTF